MSEITPREKEAMNILWDQKGWTLRMLRQAFHRREKTIREIVKAR